MQARSRLDEGWSTVLLVLGMQLIAAMAIMQTDVIEGLEIIAMVSILAVGFGLALAKSRFSDNAAHIFALIYGLFFVFYLLGTLLPAELTWRERVLDIVARQVAWFQKVFGSGISRDGFIFVIQTAAIYWLLGYTAAWYSFRHTLVWRAIVPTGLVLFSVVYYYNGPRPLALYLAGYVLLALLYIARIYLVQQQRDWRASFVRFDSGIWFDFLRAGFVTAVLILFLSWSLPTLSASPLISNALGGARGPWRDFQDNWTRLFSSLRSYGSGVSDPYQNSITLGGPRLVGNTPIMDVYVAPDVPYLYWQSGSFDTYQDGSWLARIPTDGLLHYPDEGSLTLPEVQARQIITQTVITYLPSSGYLYAAPEIVGSDRQMIVDATRNSRGEMLVTAVRSRYVLRAGDRYTVASRVTTADAASLRAAPRVYPDWVEDYYLQLPASVTAETIDLAATITAPHDTPYDKALAVQDYLRETIAYNDQIAAAPDGVDPVHHMLFVTREGYCNYYAGAMALMLRSQGIPTRVASGYAQGEYDPATGSFRVRANNAHTWVEVYFPTYGWIQFEPTAAIPVVVRAEGQTEPGAAGNSGNSGGGIMDQDRPILDDELVNDLFDERMDESAPLPETAVSSSNTRLLWQAFGALVVLIVAGSLLAFANALNRRVESNVDKSYERLGGWARWLGLSYRPAQTPLERADMLTAVVPQGGGSIRNLTQQYVRRLFSKDHTHDLRFKPLEEWRALRPLLMRQVVRRRVQRLRNSLRRRRL